MKLGKKLIALLAGLTLTASLGIAAFAAEGQDHYSDVASGTWYTQAVEYVTENSLMDGVNGSTFAPDTDATRAALAVALYRAAGSPQTGTHNFNDIPANSPYANAAAWARANGVIAGYDNGGFGGEDPITREQLVTILWRYAGSPSSGASRDFTDEGSISAYAAQAVDWSRANGVVSGYADGRFAPKVHTTRAQLAVVLQSFLTNQVTQPVEKGVVRTTSGLVQGTDQNGIYRYLGLPYAQATERFVPAEAVEPWEGIRQADSYGSISPQGSILGMTGNGDESGADNNCQNLNIWTPGINDGQKRPVMVWLHGGGFSTGSGNDPLYDGENLSRSGDVVVVAVNHRLNLFGFLDLSAYGKKYKDSGNVGMLDIVAALEWVQDNIEAFGGDSDNVTVFGQSGGGAKVLALMTSPYAEGLFHKGIVQSGATETMGVTFTGKEASVRLTQHILENLNIDPQNIEQLQTIPVSQIQEAANRALQTTAEEYQIPAALGEGYGMEWGPVVEGDFLPTNPVTEDSFAAAGRDIPLLIGSTLNEWNFFPGQGASSTPEVETAVRTAYPNKPNLTASQVDTLIRLPMLKIMSHKADQGGANVYAYIFARDSSFHGAEIPFVFRNTDDPLKEQVSQVWVNFARTDVPSADGLTAWEPYTRESGATMLLDDQPELVHHHDRELIGLLAPDYQY